MLAACTLAARQSRGGYKPADQSRGRLNLESPIRCCGSPFQPRPKGASIQLDPDIEAEACLKRASRTIWQQHAEKLESRKMQIVQIGRVGPSLHMDKETDSCLF